MQHYNIANSFVGVSSCFPDRTAVSTDNVNMTFSQLLSRASQIARLLRSDGVKAGDRIGIAVPQPIDAVSIALGLWMLDVTICVIDFRTRAEERTKLSKAFDFTAIIQARTPPGVSGYEAISASPEFFEKAKSQNSSILLPEPALHPALISATSGTTGTPAGISRNHMTYLMRFLHLRQIEQTGKSLICLPLNNSVALNAAMMHLLSGGEVVFPAFLSDAEGLAEQLQSTKVSSAFVVPTQLRGLLGLSANSSKPLFPDLKCIRCGGAPTTAEENIRAYRELSEGYIVSYASSMIGRISELIGSDIVAYPDTVGPPLPLNLLKILRPDGSAAEIGESGIIHVRGPAVCDEVLGEPRESSDRLVDGWAMPGDLGFLDERGYLTLTGRASDMIIRGGVNVFPRELEKLLGTAPGVEEVAVIGYPEKTYGEEIAAVLVLKPGTTPESIQQFAKIHLTQDKCPRHFHVVEALPINQMGKVIKRELVAEFVEHLASEKN